jgi:CYTH domain-containing protein
MTTLTLQVTEVLFDFDDDDFTPEEQQLVVDTTLGEFFEVEVDDANDDREVADALVEEVTDFAQWCVVSLNFRHVLNTF